MMSNVPDTVSYVAKDPILDRARLLLGPILTQYILEQSSKPTMDLDGTHQYHLHSGTAALANAVQIATMLNEVEDASTIEAWFAGRNPLLGDRAPAVVILTDQAAVRRAARRFLAQG